MTDVEALARAGVLFEEERYEDARELAQRVLDDRERLYGLHDPRVAEALHRLARIYEIGIDESASPPLFARALAIYEATPRPDAIALAALIRDYANAHCTPPDEHVAMLGRAVESYEREYGPHDPRVAEVWLEYAEACHRSHRTHEARRAVERALDGANDDLREKATAILWRLDRVRGPEAKLLWTDGDPSPATSPLAGELLDIAHDARLEGRHADARQIESEVALHRRADRIAESNIDSLACICKFSRDIWGFTFSRDGARLALHTEAGIHLVRVGDLAIDRLVETGEIWNAAIAAHGSRLLLRDYGHVFVFSADDGGYVEYRGYIETGDLSVIAIGPDDDLFAIAGKQRISIARLSAPGVIREIMPGAGSEGRAAFLDGGETLAVADYAGPLRRWRVADGEPLPPLPGPAKTRSFDVAPNGDIVVEDVWEVAIVRPSDGSVRTFRPGHGDTICALAVSPDGQLLATAGFDRKVIVLRMADGERLHTLERDAFRLQFSPDGCFLAIQERTRKGAFYLYGITARRASP